MLAQSSPNTSVQQVVAQMPDAVWRANQMGSYASGITSSGYPTLDAELPNMGWPASSLIELLVQQNGIGEMQLLRPALAAIAKQRRVALVQFPHSPQISSWIGWGLPIASLLWIKTTRTADALWAAEQVLRNGNCGALLFWQSQVRSEMLRRLHLAAQGSETTFWMIRPLASAENSSPSPLRLVLRPARSGILIEMIKRRGPQQLNACYLPLPTMPSTPSSALVPSNPASALAPLSLLHDHAFLDKRASAAAAARNLSPAVV
jgi:protein ImuA